MGASAANHVSCSFCGKRQDRVGKIVAGSGVYICNECIQLCQDIIGEQEGPGGRRSPPARLPPLAAEDWSCDSCGISYADTALAEAIDAIELLPARLGNIMQAVPASTLRVRASPEVWSPIEYLCHIRDVLASATIRLYRTRTDEVPSVEPMFNDLRTARFGYANRQVEAVLAEITDDTAGFLAEAAQMPTDGWQRRMQRLPGETRTATWLARQAMHEGEHHLLDIIRTAGVN